MGSETDISDRDDVTEIETLVTLDEDDRLAPDFVRSVLDALDDGAHEEARHLVQPLHAADIADLFELTPRDQIAVAGRCFRRFDERGCARRTQRLCP